MHHETVMNSSLARRTTRTVSRRRVSARRDPIWWHDDDGRGGIQVGGLREASVFRDVRLGDDKDLGGGARRDVEHLRNFRKNRKDFRARRGESGVRRRRRRALHRGCLRGGGHRQYIHGALLQRERGVVGVADLRVGLSFAAFASSALETQVVIALGGSR